MVNKGIDILIPYHSQYQMLRECIGSIFLYTRHIPFQITVIDDCSPNKEFFSNIAQCDKQVDGIRLDEHSGFGKAVNQGIMLTKKPWIVLLNSDCIIKEMDWLIKLYENLNKHMGNKIGMVSSTMNDGSYCKAVERNNKGKKFIISNDPLPMICCMMPRKLFEKVGLLKEYKLGYEDEEFFWRMNKFGYKQGICEESWVFHHGGATSKKLHDEKLQEENRMQCLADIQLLSSKARKNITDLV